VAMAPLVIESRHAHASTKKALEEMQGKLDGLNKKIEGLNNSALQPFGNQMTPNMESTVLMYNVQRIIQENERLKKEVYEKSARIEQQNEKINDLLSRNQKFVEEHNTMLEQRNDSFKHTTAQAQARVLELEQEKVKRTEELAQATKLIGALQDEMALQRSTEADLQAKLLSTATAANAASEQLTVLQATSSGSSAQLEELSRALREERQAVKEAAKKIEKLTEDVREAEAEKESAVKKFDTLRRKQADTTSAKDFELEELRAHYEAELEALKKKIRSEKLGRDAALADALEERESELTAMWTDKSARAVTAVETRYQARIASMEEDYNTLSTTVEGLRSALKSKDSEERLHAIQQNYEQASSQLEDSRSKVESLRSSLASKTATISELEERVETLREKARAESLIELKSAKEVAYKRGLADGREEMQGVVAKLEAKAASAEAKARGAEARASGASAVAGAAAGEVSFAEKQIRELISIVYRVLRGQFADGKQYSSSDVLAKVLEAFRAETLKFVDAAKGVAAAEDDEEEYDDEEEEEEEEGEEEDKEDDENDENEEEEENEKDEKDEKDGKEEREGEDEVEAVAMVAGQAEPASAKGNVEKAANIAGEAAPDMSAPSSVSVANDAGDEDSGANASESAAAADLSAAVAKDRNDGQMDGGLLVVAHPPPTVVSHGDSADEDGGQDQIQPVMAKVEAAEEGSREDAADTQGVASEKQEEEVEKEEEEVEKEEEEGENEEEEEEKEGLAIRGKDVEEKTGEKKGGDELDKTLDGSVASMDTDGEREGEDSEEGGETPAPKISNPLLGGDSDDDDDDAALFDSAAKTTPKKAEPSFGENNHENEGADEQKILKLTKGSAKTDFFGDDDEGDDFFSAPATVAKPPKAGPAKAAPAASGGSSLFGEDDDDDDDWLTK
jgi:hypothetical protein